ncbi:MAG: nicotinate phosphoribosyltransferase [Steroidobacteraceae bacterium]|nr:nicotinate phosphoribosyltransferase [Deltaproteobacteria bacterium]
MRYSPLLTDLYELTMLAGYLEEGMVEKKAVFDLYFRTNPFEGGYAVFAGLEPALDFLEQFRFSKEELDFLTGLGLFKPRFIDYLSEFSFRGRVTAPPEGSLVFANEPLLTVEGTLAEAQFVETTLLNMINFQTLTATKAARICHAAEGTEVVEFGLRRAQGPDGGLSASRAACVGGCKGTSNVLAGKLFGLPLCGTQAHSWVQAFPDELAAFRAYADTFPESTILLVDTYDTLRSGVPNAITVAEELRAGGHELRGIRIDSGDLAYLSREARRMLDEAGFRGVGIVVSNDLDEYLIESVRSEGGRVDFYGIGTRLATCAGAGGGALGGVYKLVEIDGEPKLKVTGDIAKSTLPGKKKLFRFVEPGGGFIQDVVCLAGEIIGGGDTVYDPVNPLRHTTLPAGARLTEFRGVVMEAGRRTVERESLEIMAERCKRELNSLPSGCLRLINPHRYKVSISNSLNNLRGELIERAEKKAP